MTGAPTFNGAKLTKRAKRQVGFVLQVCFLGPTSLLFVVTALYRPQSNGMIVVKTNVSELG